MPWAKLVNVLTRAACFLEMCISMSLPVQNHAVAKNAFIWSIIFFYFCLQNRNRILKWMKYGRRHTFRDCLVGPTFLTILNEFWTDFLQFSAKDGGVLHPSTPPLMCAPVAMCCRFCRLYSCCCIKQWRLLCLPCLTGTITCQRMKLNC